MRTPYFGLVAGLFMVALGMTGLWLGAVRYTRSNLEPTYGAFDVFAGLVIMALGVIALVDILSATNGH